MEGSSICCKVTGPREYSRDLRQGGLQIPCIFEFRGKKENVQNTKETIRKQREYREKMGLPSDAEEVLEDATSSTTDTSQATSTHTVISDTDESAGTQNMELLSCSSTTKAEIINVDVASEGGVEETHYSVTEPVLLPRSSSSSKYIAVEHNYCKNEPPRVWVRHGRSVLTIAERDMINYGKQLNDRHINYAQTVIRSQFSIKGMQLTLYQHTKKPPENELQIIHCSSNHWITASTMFSSPGSVDVYDSLFDNVDCASSKVILDLFGDSKLHINMKKVQKQHGTDDCGLFAIAFAVSLARKVDPASSHVCFEQSRMRSHLINCLQEANFCPFPTKPMKL